MTSSTTPKSPQPVVVARRRLSDGAGAGDGAGEWAGLVARVSEALVLPPDVVVLHRGPRGRAAVAALLARASGLPGPVLVLPPPDGASGPGRAPSPRALIVSDASDEMAVATRVVMEALLVAGFRPGILLVLTEDNQPRMWEGSGHNADQWFDEMRRRHGAGPETLTVVTGDPEHEFATFAMGADLVIMVWHHDASSDRAPLLRSVLQGGITVPHLLLPLPWVETLRPGT